MWLMGATWGDPARVKGLRVVAATVRPPLAGPPRDVCTPVSLPAPATLPTLWLTVRQLSRGGGGVLEWAAHSTASQHGMAWLRSMLSVHSWIDAGYRRRSCSNWVSPTPASPSTCSAMQKARDSRAALRSASTK